jgi:uncharacterized repeat protein (TIGR03803 family)
MPRRTLFSILAFAALLAGVQMFSCTVADAQTETVLHSFQSNSKTDGNGPYGLVADSRGALYGVTYGGGRYAQGSVFKLSPPATQGGAWKQSVLYSFTGNADGGGPSGSLVLDSASDKLYGTTTHGGGGVGVIFELTPGAPWTETVLHTFGYGKDGIYPDAGLISDGHGTMYGTTSSGGTDDNGTVFRLSPPKAGSSWTETPIYSFQGGGTDGWSPEASLVMDANDALYGTTSAGGENNVGAVFKVTPPDGGHGPWTESVIYSFTGGADGEEPEASLIFDSSGSLYGTTFGGGVTGGQCGCGTVFELTPPSGGSGLWTENTLYTFTDGTDGAEPRANLISDSTGALYGTTTAGGTQTECAGELPGCGTVFELSAPGEGGSRTFSVLHAFQNGSDGAYPIAPLLLVGGNFYGTTYLGGEKGIGTVFEIVP